MLRLFRKIGQLNSNKDAELLNITSELKTTTAYIHKKLHTHPVMSALLSPALTEQQYIAILQSLSSFYTQLNVAISKLGINCELLGKDQFNLKQDLKALQADQCFDNIPTSSGEQFDFILKDFNHYLGLRYVIQGSHLGAQVISNHVSKTLGVCKQTGLAFYCAEGKETGRAWNQYKQYIELHCDNVIHASDAANAVFFALESHLWSLYNWHPRLFTLNATPPTSED